MKAFLEAFGGLIGVGLIGIAAVVAMVAADALMTKFTRRPPPAEDDEAGPSG